jgi:predicted O-methyltransferase YrrM
MNFLSVVNYLKYILLSHHNRGHGIHSPFVFDLVSRVLWNKVDPDIVCTVEKLRKKMISDNRTILINDLGSRSDLLKTNFRKVSDIARYSPVPGKYGELLSKMAVEFGKPLIIEFGTSLGISTLYMACSCTDTKVYTIEGCPATAEIAKNNFKEAGLTNIEIFEGSFDEILSVLTNSGIKPGLVFIDGNHRKGPVIKYFNQMAELSENNTVIIIDDINYSKEMREAWDEILHHEKVTVTIDIFRMGFVFFRAGINHKNYIIRY